MKTPETKTRRRGKGEHTYLVVEREAVVGVLDELVDGEGGVVGLHHRVGHLLEEGRGEGRVDR